MSDIGNEQAVAVGLVALEANRVAPGTTCAQCCGVISAKDECISVPIGEVQTLGLRLAHITRTVYAEKSEQGHFWKETLLDTPRRGVANGLSGKAREERRSNKSIHDSVASRLDQRCRVQSSDQ